MTAKKSFSTLQKEQIKIISQETQVESLTINLKSAQSPRRIRDIKRPTDQDSSSIEPRKVEFNRENIKSMLSPRGMNSSVKRGEQDDSKPTITITAMTQRDACESPIKSALNGAAGMTNQSTVVTLANDRKNMKMVESILYNKAQQSNGKPREIVRQYLKRSILTSTATNPDQIIDKIVFQMKQNEGHIRRGAEKRGWVENKNPNSQIFDVKFEVSDQAADYTNLRPVQIFNHFPNNTEVTTKAGLMRNLYGFPQPGMIVDSFFPRSFDLSDPRQGDELLATFQECQILSILKKLYSYLKLHAPHAMRDVYTKLTSLKQRPRLNYRETKSNLVLELLQSCPPEFLIEQTEDKMFLIPSRVISRLFNYCKVLIRNRTFNDLVKNEIRNPKESHDDTLDNSDYCQLNDFDFGHMVLSEKHRKQFLKFSELSPPYSDYPEGFKKPNRSSWEQPSMYLIYKICKYHKLLKRVFPQYKIDGMRNIWIVKPSYNARGFGIYLVDTVKELVQGGKKGQQKIVQKYIERPYLLKVQQREVGSGNDKSPRPSQSGGVSMRKFDIRQWVLVTSVEPLVIYSFSDFYLRICGSDFNLNDIQDAFRHLSNYTIQKTQKKDEELQMSQGQFADYLKQNEDANVDYMAKIRSSLNEIIVSTFQAAQDSQLDHRPNCFEVYGFDFLLDYNLKPWLIEVNLSPACAERTDWLTEMLDGFTDGLLNIIEGKLLRGCDDYDTELKAEMRDRSGKPSSGKHQWELIYDQRIDPQYYRGDVQDKSSLGVMPLQKDQTQPLDILGRKINLKAERQVGKLYRMNLASIIVQKHWRGHRARSYVYHRKLEILVVYIQKWVRMWLQRKRYLRVRDRERASRIIQKRLRQYLNVKKPEVDLAARVIQKHVRTYLAKKPKTQRKPAENPEDSPSHPSVPDNQRSQKPKTLKLRNLFDQGHTSLLNSAASLQHIPENKTLPSHRLLATLNPLKEEGRFKRGINRRKSCNGGGNDTFYLFDDEDDDRYFSSQKQMGTISQAELGGSIRKSTIQLLKERKESTHKLKSHISDISVYKQKLSQSPKKSARWLEPQVSVKDLASRPQPQVNVHLPDIQLGGVCLLAESDGALAELPKKQKKVSKMQQQTQAQKQQLIQYLKARRPDFIQMLKSSPYLIQTSQNFK